MTVLLTWLTLFSLSIASGEAPLPDPPTAGTLELTVENIESASGALEITAFSGADNYMRRGKTVRVSVDRTGQIRIPLEDLPFGEYALVIYHDVNGDRRFDQNILGIPKEPYGFSNNIRPRFSSPEYEECKFVFSENGQAVNIRIGGIWD
jgi:uncharacterized protein (DUF2141 family)